MAPLECDHARGVKVDYLVLFFSLVIHGAVVFFSRRLVQGGFACTFLETSQNDRARKPTRTVLDIDDFDDAVFFAVVLSINQDGIAAPISRLGLRS